MHQVLTQYLKAEISFSRMVELINEEADDHCHHNISQLGYVAWHEWADRKARQGHKQRQCPKCKKWLFKCEM
jgi:hypothetical protein